MPHSVSLWNDLSDHVFNGMGLAGFKSRANFYLLANLFFLYVSNSLSLFLPSRGWLCGVWALGLIGCSRSLLALHCRLFFNNNNNNNNNVETIIVLVLLAFNFISKGHTTH